MQLGKIKQLNCAAWRQSASVTIHGFHVAQRKSPDRPANCYAGSRQDDICHTTGISNSGRHNDVSSFALPHSQAAREAESYHHEQAPRRAFTSYDDDERQLARKATSSSTQNLRYKTIMLKVSGEALQVTVLAT